MAERSRGGDETGEFEVQLADDFADLARKRGEGGFGRTEGASLVAGR